MFTIERLANYWARGRISRRETDIDEGLDHR